MTAKAIKQFKLSNGDEVICEIVEKGNPLSIKSPLVILFGDKIQGKLQFFTFRPWMGFNNDPESIHHLYTYHIIGEVIPPKDLRTLYLNTIEKIKSFEKHKYVDIDRINELDENEVEPFLESQLNSMDDSNRGSNIISFGRRTIH